jgi:CrcB protein
MKLIPCILVFIGGGIGVFSRYGVTLYANRLFGASFPLGTLSVNLLGCLLIGLSFSMAEQKLISTDVRVFFVTGFLGGLTTFSTYAVESIINFRDGMHGIAFLNLAANNLAGLALVIIGLWLGRLI